jgi:hypothetical protein
MKGGGEAQPGCAESMSESSFEWISESIRRVAPRLAVSAPQTRPRIADGGCGEAIEDGGEVIDGGGGGGGVCGSAAGVLNGERCCSFSHTLTLLSLLTFSPSRSFCSSFALLLSLSLFLCSALDLSAPLPLSPPFSYPLALAVPL